VNGVVQISVVGVILAALFAAGLLALLLWMLRVPRPVSAEVARAVHSVGAVRTILVPILEARAVELASRLGQMQKAVILVGYIIVVPRTLSLGVPLPQVEEHAGRALERAKTIVEMHELEAGTEIIRARDAGEGIVRAARDRDVDLIVLGISPVSGLLEGSTARVAEALLRQAPCEVIIDKLAETSIGEAQEEAPGTPSESDRLGAPVRPV